MFLLTMTKDFDESYWTSSPKKRVQIETTASDGFQSKVKYYGIKPATAITRS